MEDAESVSTVEDLTAEDESDPEVKNDEVRVFFRCLHWLPW